MLKRLRVLAFRKHTGYQTLLKTFVVERLYEEELREGLIVPSRAEGSQPLSLARTDIVNPR